MPYKYLIGKTLFEWAEYRFIFSALERGYTGSQIRTGMRTLFGRGIGDPVLSIARSYYADGVLRALQATRRSEGRGIEYVLNIPLQMSPVESQRTYLVQGMYRANVDGVPTRIDFSFNSEGFAMDDLERRSSEIWDLLAKNSLEDAELVGVVFEHINLVEKA